MDEEYEGQVCSRCGNPALTLQDGMLICEACGTQAEVHSCFRVEQCMLVCDMQYCEICDMQYCEICDMLTLAWLEQWKVLQCHRIS